MQGCYDRYFMMYMRLFLKHRDVKPKCANRHSVNIEKRMIFMHFHDN